MLKNSSFIRFVVPLCFGLMFLPIGGFAFSGQGTPKVEQQVTEPVQARLIAEEQAIQPGRPFWVGIELKMQKGWDTYWQNPGDSGFATQVKWDLPPGFQAGPLQWPYPQKFVNDSLVAFGYTDTVLLMAQITPPVDLKAVGSIPLKASVNWLACKDACVPGEATLSLSLPIGTSPPLQSKDAASFVAARQLLPQDLTDDRGNLSVHTQTEQIVLNFKSEAFGEVEKVEFIPEEGQIIDYQAPQNVQMDQAGFTLNLKLADPSGIIPEQLKGVLLVSEKGNSTTHAIRVDKILSEQGSVLGEGVTSIGMALGFAFLGGIILNAMPCVLPVMALKIFSFVKMAHQKRSVIIQHGAVFSLGVLISFWLLSGALLVLRAYGEGIGWGFQLQEPVFVAVLAGLLFLLGLSLFGVFEFGTSMISLSHKASEATGSSTSPLRNSFMSGVLATLVATPCTGPLLGPALGFAMTLPTLKALSIFTMMGLGMAFPYLFFSLFPKFVRFLPKPGNWMIAFKQLMGFLMMGTVVWLTWVFGAQTDNLATFIFLASLLFLAIGAWIFGRWATPDRKKRTRVIATMVTAVLILIGGGSVIQTAKMHRGYTSASAEGVQLVADTGWEAYSPQKVASLQAQGIPVFVDFTAKWCLICQANKVVLHSAGVEEAFEKKGVVTMTADWTKKDPVITQELQKLGRSGVPVYVLYPGDTAKKPTILPQTLTPNTVYEYLDKLPDSKTTVWAD